MISSAANHWPEGQVNGMIIGIQSHESREWNDDDKYTIHLIGETALAVWLHNQSIEALKNSQQQFSWAMDAAKEILESDSACFKKALPPLLRLIR